MCTDLELFILFISLSLCCCGQAFNNAPEVEFESNGEKSRTSAALHYTNAARLYDSPYYEYFYESKTENIEVKIVIAKQHLTFNDTNKVDSIPYSLNYSASSPIALSYQLDSNDSVELVNASWHWLSPTSNLIVNNSIHIKPKRLGLTYLRFCVHQTTLLSGSNPIELVEFASSEKRSNCTNESHPLIVLREKSTLNVVFRVIVILMVVVYTFTMGCDLQSEIMKSYMRKPIAPLIGFCCQFILMPVISFAIAKLLPIQRHFGFGLLMVGCSPGGGASNAWALLFDGDINLSILMTFISSCFSLFMMPLLLFIFARFFLDMSRVHIPYAHIIVQMLQVITPALLGLLFRYFRPNYAIKVHRLTKPMIGLFILLFMTFGIYVNWSILSLIPTFPILILASALLPALTFSLSAFIAHLLRQSARVIVTITLETGIQNSGIAILVLLYSMPKPEGDLAAIIPFTIAYLTPISLSVTYLIKLVWHKFCAAREKLILNSGNFQAADT